MRKMGIGVQLYTLRNETAADFPGTLRKVAELGYEGVEFAGYGGLSAEEMKALLQELNLKVPGSHVSLERLRNDLQGEIDYLKAIGGQAIIVPWAPDEGEEGWKSLISELQTLGAEVRKQGLGFGYHNHAFEFESKVGDAFVFDAIFESQPELLVEMDACWVHRGGQDPVAYIRKYAGRLPFVHAKDYKVEGDSTVTLELGQGIVALDEVIGAASDAGVEWLIVEQDNCQNPPLESISNSMNWLKEHYLKRV
ncbi:sugar phosphate isomerase/epimerase family protein [Paenibacillus puerhi]|uniref:sugar phosphate isomerase/epimerase family protein n=1 Tax=Paenibacillus puerhi TaxID=2692622 RepID=UPI001356F3CB|nr:sugar phosphate isomerase/epimerase [Paenibacillus puerhi]